MFRMRLKRIGTVCLPDTNQTVQHEGFDLYLFCLVTKVSLLYGTYETRQAGVTAQKLTLSHTSGSQEVDLSDLVLQT